MNNKMVITKALEKTEYLKSLYTKDNKSWNRIIYSFIQDIVCTLEDFSTRTIRQEDCDKELIYLEKITLDYIIANQLKAELITSRLCRSCYKNFGVSSTHELKFDFNEVEVRFRYSIDNYDKDTVYKLPLSEYFMLNEKFCKLEDKDRSALHSAIEELKNTTSIEKSIRAHISIVLSKYERIDKEELEENGYQINENKNTYSIIRYIPNINEESIDLNYLFDLGIRLVKIYLSSNLYNEDVTLLAKTNRRDEIIVTIIPSTDTSEEFLEMVKNYIDKN